MQGHLITSYTIFNMIFKLPQNGQWSQLNKGDTLGTLYGTRNIELDDLGVIRLARRTTRFGQTTTGNYLDLHAVEYYGGFFYYASNRIFRSSSQFGGFTEDTSSGAPSSQVSDLCVWNGSMYAARTSRVSQLTGSTWTNDWSTSNFANTSTGFVHPIEPNVTNQNLLAGDGNILRKIASDGTVDVAVTFPSHLRVLWIRRGLGVNYIGLGVQDSSPSPTNHGAVAIWDGLDTTIGANRIIWLNGRTPIIGEVDDSGVLYILTPDGVLHRYNGSGFSELAELPIRRNFALRGTNWGGSATLFGWVAPRGMKFIRGKLHVSLNASPLKAPEFQSGVWCYDPEVNAFYHKYGVSITLTDTDFGISSDLISVGAIYPIPDARENEPRATGGRDVLVTGARLLDSDTSGAPRSVMSVSSGKNRGFFETSRINTPEIYSNDISLWVKYKGLNNDGDKIVVKYRTKERPDFPVSMQGNIVEWSSANTFVADNSFSDFFDIDKVKVGDEVQVTSGIGAGCLAHITDIQVTSNVYTFTLDEDIPGIVNGSKTRVIIDNWTKLSTEITHEDTKGFKRIPLPNISSTWIQFKIDMRGQGYRVAVEELQIVKTPNLPAT